MNNILVLSAGRRVELIKSFQVAAKRIGIEAKVIAADYKPFYSSACYVADFHISTPHVASDGYIDSLLQVCKENEVGLVVPTIDTELLILAKHREKFERQEINIIISDDSLIDYCRDKRKSAELFKDIKIDSPEIYPRSAIKFPCFSKPYDGSCSIGAAALFDASMLTGAILENDKMMFMELIDGNCYTEFTVDIYYDRFGALKCLVPRQRIEVRGGEVSKGVTRKGPIYDYLLNRMHSLQGARGCITFQVFVDISTNKFYALEINPRFGGGFPLTDCAGAKYPEWLIREYLLCEKIAFFDDWEENLMMLRYDAHVLVKNAS